MNNIKVVKPGIFGNKIIFIHGFIRLSTNGTLQVMGRSDREGRPSGDCLLALATGSWISAEVVKWGAKK